MCRAITPATLSVLQDVIARAQAAPHGQKSAIYSEACHLIKCSHATLMRMIDRVAVKPSRKRRIDAGVVLLPRDEAVVISALLMDSLRKNNKRLKSIGDAVETLRANGEIRAERIDPATGECLPLSINAISHALRSYKLHPDQLLRPAPHTEQRSLYPNHVWQIDASLCVLYYLHAQNDRERGLQVMAHSKFYKNKPRNLKKIENDRVWSYEVTDHFSGAIFVHYVMGAESVANLAESFILATQQRADAPFYGVPYILYVDPGAAMTAGAVKNLLRRLGVKLIPHAPGNAKATGQVENARNIIERSFESGLRLRPVADLAELNARAQHWAHWYNATKIHRRHGKTRYEKWMEIETAQLRTVSADLMRELLTHAPETRDVTPRLTVNFNGREYDVRDIPRVMVGEKINLTYNPYQPDTAVVVDHDADGHEVLYTVPQVERDADGFRRDAPVLGEEFAALPDTVADTHRKLVERVAMEAQTDEDAAKKRKQRVPSFGGRIDPDALIRQADIPAYLPKRGSDLLPPVRTASTVPERVYSHFEIAAELIRRGLDLTAEHNASIARQYPDGVKESEVDALFKQLNRPPLRVVGGK